MAFKFREKLTPKRALTIGVIMTTVGIGIVGLWFYPDLSRAQESLSWPTTEALITSSVVNKDSNGTRSLSVIYSYRVDEKEYSSAKLYVGVDSGRLKISDSIATKEHKANYKKFKVGEKYPAYYNPADPSYAVLDPGPKQHHYIFLIAFGILPLIGLGFIAWGKKKLKENESKKISRPSKHSALK